MWLVNSLGRGTRDTGEKRQHASTSTCPPPRGTGGEILTGGTQTRHASRDSGGDHGGGSEDSVRNDC